MRIYFCNIWLNFSKNYYVSSSNGATKPTDQRLLHIKVSNKSQTRSIMPLNLNRKFPNFSWGPKNPNRTDPLQSRRQLPWLCAPWRTITRYVPCRRLVCGQLSIWFHYPTSGYLDPPSQSAISQHWPGFGLLKLKVTCSISLLIDRSDERWGKSLI